MTKATFHDKVAQVSLTLYIKWERYNTNSI